MKLRLIPLFLLIFSIASAQDSKPTLQELDSKIADYKSEQSDLESQIAKLNDQLKDVKVFKAKVEQDKADFYPESIELPEGQTVFDSVSYALSNFSEDHDLKIRRSVYNDSSFGKPASFQFTSPGTGADSYAVDIGVSFDLLPENQHSNLFNLNAAVDYHRNTLTDSLSDTFLGGLTSTVILGDASEGSAHFFDISTFYKNDQVNTDDGFLGGITYLPLSPKYAMGKRLDHTLHGFVWQPYLGVQHEYGSNIDMTAQSGDTLRGIVGADVAVYPFHKALSRRLELIGSFKHWNNLQQSGGFGVRENSYDLWSASANWYFDTDERFAVGLDYLEGSDPQEGFFDDQFWRFAFKIKL